MLLSTFLVNHRWCKDLCTIQPSELLVPMSVSSVEGEEIEQDYPVAVLWPWDVLAALWESGQFLRWVSDDPSEASDRVEEYWRHCVNLSFFGQLDLQEGDFRMTVPLFFHADGVKIYKHQKAWVYSYASACRKGGSLETKLVLLLLREQMIVKNKSHDKVGHTIGYIVRTLMSGKYPMTNVNGERFDTSSPQAAKAGLPFAGGWRLCFAAFKGDWEARQIIHKSTRFYNARYICEHCMASREPQFTYADFRMNAACMSKRFTHAEYRILQGDKQSSWESVPGWCKERNLEEACLEDHVFVYCTFCFVQTNKKGMRWVGRAISPDPRTFSMCTIKEWHVS